MSVCLKYAFELPAAFEHVAARKRRGDGESRRGCPLSSAGPALLLLPPPWRRDRAPGNPTSFAEGRSSAAG